MALGGPTGRGIPGRAARHQRHAGHAGALDVFVVQGQMYANGVLEEGIQDIRLPFGQKVTANATSEMRLAGNLNASAPTAPAGFDVSDPAQRAATPGALGENTVASVLQRIYDLGIKPDWWKLEPQPSEAAWSAIAQAIDAGDPRCRGVLLLGLAAFCFAAARLFVLPIQL